MAGLSTGAPIVQVYHEKSRILPDVSRVLACLYEKDIKFETHTASYKSLLKLQASTHAPVPFYDGPVFLEESREICRHIAEKYEHVGYPYLLGKDALERASVEQWLHNEEYAFNPPSRALFCHLAFPPDKYDNGDDIDMHKRKLEDVLEVYEQRLSDSEFLAGNMFTLADLVHLPNSHYITSSDKFVYLYDSRKNVRRWWDTISSRRSWQQVLMHMKRVEERNKQEELKEQEQKNRPKTPGYPLGIYPRETTQTEPRTVFIHPAGSVSSSSIAPQTEKPLPIDIADEPLVSSSQSTPTDHKTSVAKSKVTPFQVKPPKKSPIPVHSTIVPITSPNASEKPQIVGADRSTKGASTPEPTKTYLPTRHKPSSSKDVSNNLRVFDYYKASSHSEEVTAYIEPTPQKSSETLDQFSGSSIAAGHNKTSSIPTKEEPDQHSIYKSDSTSTRVESQDEDSIPYNEHTPQSARPTDSTVSKLHRTDVHHKRQVEQWHAATTVPSDLKEDVDHLRPIQQVKSSKVVQWHASQDSEQATSRPVPQGSMSMELLEGQSKITQRPYAYQGRDVSSPLPQQNGGARGISADDKASSVQSSALLPTTQKHAETTPRKGAAKEAHSTSPPQAGYRGGQDTNKQLRDPDSIARQIAVQATFGESKAAASMIPSWGSSDAFRSPLSRQDLDAARHATAPYEKRDHLTKDTTEQTKDIISTPWQVSDQDTNNTENTTEETKNSDSSSFLVQPSYVQRAKGPSEKQEQGTTEGLVRKKEATEDHHGATSPIHKRHANIEDTTGQYKNIAFKPKQMISEDDRDTIKEANFGDPSLLREQPLDTRQAATTTDEETNQDDLSVASPLERTQTVYPSVTASRTRYPFTKDASKQPRGALSTPRHKPVQDANDTSEESMITDEVAPTDQHLNARRPPISPRRQEVEYSPREITSFQKRPHVEDKHAGDTTSQQIAPTGVKDTFEETKVGESSLASAKPMYTGQSAVPPRRQAKLEYSQEKGRQSKASSPEPQKMVSRDTRDTHGERKTGTPGKQSSERSQAILQPRPAAAEDAGDATGETVQFPNILDTTNKTRGTFEETQHAGHAGPTLPRARPFGAQDAPESKTPTVDHQRMDDPTQLQSDVQDWFLQSKLPAADQKGLGSLSSQERDAKDLHATLSEEKPVSSERLREMIKKTQPTAPEEHHIDSQGSIKVEKRPFLYQKKPLFAQDSQDQAQIIPRGGKGDDSTWEHEESSDGPYNAEKLSGTAQARAKSRNDFDAEESHKKDTTDDQKVVSPLRSKEPTSQVQLPSGPSQDAAPHGDLSSKLSTIEQWQRAYEPLKDMTTSSGERRVETPILPMEPEASGLQSTSPLLPEAATTDHAVIDDKFAQHSITDERLGEQKQMRAPVTDVRPASPTKRKTSDGPETSGLELVESSGDQVLDAAKVTPPGPATIREDSHDAAVDEKTKTYNASGDQLLHEQPRPPAPTHEATDPIGGLRASKEPQFRGGSQAEVAHAEGKSTLSDKKPTRAAQPLSPLEPVNIDGNHYAADDTIAPQMIFRQETRPSAPVVRGVPASDSQSVTRKIQAVTPDYRRIEDSVKPLVPNQDDQISRASQTIPHQEDMQYSPSTRDSQKWDIQPPLAQVHEVTRDESSGKQGSHVASAFGPNELGAAGPSTAKSRNDFNAEESRTKEADDHKVISPTRSKEPTSQVQPPSGPLQDAASHGDLSSKLSTIEQWQRAYEPLNDVTTSSGDDEMAIPTIYQKPTPMSQQGSRNAHGANQMAKESGAQRQEPPILPIEPETSGIQSTPPSFQEASTAHHATIDEIIEEPIQIPAPLPDGHPASAPTKRATQDGHEIADDLKLASIPDGLILDSTKARHYPATVHDDVHHANLSTDDVDKDTFRGTKVADSTPLGARPMYTEEPALIPSRHAEDGNAGDEGRKSSKTIPERQKMLERKTGISEEQSSDPPKVAPTSRQAEAENGHDATGGMIPSPNFRATSKKFGGTFDEARGPSFTLPEAQPLGDQDAQRTNGESATPSADQQKQNESKAPKVQLTDSQDPIREEKTFSVYQTKPSVAQLSRDQAQTMPTGEKEDEYTPKHQQAFYAPYTFDKELSAHSPSISKTHDNHSADDQKLAPLLSKELTSQGQPPSELSKDAAYRGDFSATPSTISQWKRASGLLDDGSSDGKEMTMSTIDQKPTPPSQEGTLNAEGDNQMAKENGERREKPPVPIGAETLDHGTMKNKFAKKSVIDKRIGEAIQVQAASPDAHPTSDAHAVGDSELIITPDGQILEATKAMHDPAIVNKDVHDANVLSRDVSNDTFKGMKAADSTPSSSKSVYTQKPALTPSMQAEVEEARDEGRQSSKDIPEQQNLVERETGTSEGQLSDHRPSGQEAVEDVRGVTGVTLQSPDILDTTTKSRDTFEETKTPNLLQAQPFGSQDVQPTNEESVTPTSGQRRDFSTKPQKSVQDVFKPSKLSGTNQRDSGSLSLGGKDAKDAETIVAEEKIFSTERLREMLKESESTMPKAQPSDSARYTSEEKTSSIHQKRPLAAQESQEQAQIIPAGEKGDGSTLKHQQSSDAPHTLDEKFSAPAPARADIRDDPRAEVSYRKDTTANQKVEPPLLSQKPTSEVHHPSEPYQDAAPHGDLSNKLSSIVQWQHESAPLKEASTDSDDNVINMSSNIKQKPMPMSQEGHPSSQHANQMAQQSDEQTVEPPEHAATSLPEAATADHAVIDDKFANQSIIDEIWGEPKQMQAPITDARPASSSTRGKIPDGRETGDLELGESSEGQILDTEKATSPDPATIREDSHNAANDEKTTAYEQARPPAPTHEVTEPIGARTSNEPELGGSSPTDVVRSEHKSTLSGSDQKPARAAQLLSPVEPVKIDNNDSIAPQMIFRQQTRPSTPITRGVPALDSQSVARKIQDATPDNRTDDSGKPPVPSQEDQILHASQAIPRQEDIMYSPRLRDSPKSDTQLPSGQLHEVTPNESSEKQGSHVGSSFRTDKSGPDEMKFAPSGLGHSAEEPSSAEPRKEHPAVPTAEQIKALPTVIGQQGTPETIEVPTREDALDTIPTHGDVHSITSTKPPRIPFSVQGEEPTSSAQAPPFHVAHDTLHTGTTPDDALENAQSMKPSASPDAQHGIAPENNAGQDAVHSKQSPPSTVQRNEVIGDSAPETQQISSTGQAKGIPTTLDQQEILSTPLRLVSSSSDTQRPSEKAREDALDDLREAVSKPPSHIREVRPPRVVPASARDTQDETAPDEADPNENKFVPPEPTSSTESRDQDIRPSVPSTQLISSTETRKENATIAAPGQDKDLQTTLDQQEILSAPVKSASSSSYTHHPSQKARDDASAELGEAASKSSALVGEVRPSTVVPESAPVTQHGGTRDEALEKQKFVPSGQNSVLLRNEIGESAPSTQKSSTRPRKGGAAASAPDQAMDTQMTLGRQDLLPPVRLVSQSSDTQRPSVKVHEDVPAADLREAKNIVQGSSPDNTQDEKKFAPSEPTSSTEPRNKEIGDSSTDPRKTDAIVSASNQDKDFRKTLDQQGIQSTPIRSAPPSSDTQHPSEKAQEDAPADDLGEAASKSLREIRPPTTVVPASASARLHGTGSNESETTHDEQKILPSGQDSAQSVQPFSNEQTKEDPAVTTADQTEDLQTPTQHNITPSTKTPLPGTKDTSRKIPENTSDGIDTDESIPGEERVSLGQREGNATEPHQTTADERTSTSPSSKAYSSESGSGLTEARTDVRSLTGERPTEASLPDHRLQKQPPLASQDIPLDASSNAKSAGQEAKAPIASASETQSGSTQTEDEAAPIGQNFAVSDQESVHASKSPSTAGPRKGETYVIGPADQINLLGNQDTRKTPDAREALSKFQESSRDVDGISNLAKPLVSQEQASYAERASEGPTSEVHRAIFDGKATLPSSQSRTSNSGPDSTLVTGDSHLTNAMPDTSILQNQEAQPIGATQAPTTQALPASSQNIHADYLENMETPRQPSTDEIMEPVTSSAAYSDALKSEPGTTTVEPPQETSFDLSGGEKTATTQDDQVNTIVNKTNSEQELGGASTYEKSKARQTDQSDIPSSKDNNKDANEAIRSDLSTTYRELQKQSSWPKETMELSGESERDERADQAIVQSPDGNVKQTERTKTHGTETGEPEEREPQENTNRTNNVVSRVEALDISGKQAFGVQLRGANTKDASDSTDDAPDGIKTSSNSEGSLISYEESKVQRQSEGKTQGGATEAPRSDTVQQNVRDLPENSYQNNTSQSQAEASDKSAKKFSPGTQNKKKSSSGMDNPTDSTKSGDAEDKSG